MKLKQLKIEHFRGVKKAKIAFGDDAVMIGGNAVGKSTICEALDLLLGPDRLKWPFPVDEHDFHRRSYLDDEGDPVPIQLEALLIEIGDDLERRYRSHLEYFDTVGDNLLDEENNAAEIDGENVKRVLRIKFEGVYDKDEDEFKAETYFASPPPEDGERRTRVSPLDKRRFGFIYLRALRTGARALSLERGSLLDIILRLNDDDRSQMWEETLRSLEHVDPPIHEIPQLKKILSDVERRVRSFVGLSKDEPAFALFASPLTREALRRSITLFGASEHSETLVPYWRMGSGVINAMVFALLTFIAQLKKNVIFAMEEPELAIPPHTQRRIIRFLTTNMEQTIVTTHSPFVLEQFDPEDVLVLSRGADQQLSATQLDVTDLKAKTYRGGLRRVYAEALLGRGVICVEGVSDREILAAASALLEDAATPEEPYFPLDLSGVTIVQCDGEGSLAKHGAFFRKHGLKAYAFFDKQKYAGVAGEITNNFDRAWELNQTGVEKLLAEELPIDRIVAFLKEATEYDDYPAGDKYVNDENAAEVEVRDLLFRLLKVRKGHAYAERLVESCEADDLPDAIVEALEAISSDLPAPTPLLEEEAESDEDDDNEDDEA